MSLAIACPRCDHVAHTEKQIGLGSAVRCPKCKRAFEVDDDSIDRGREHIFRNNPLPVLVGESEAGEAVGVRMDDDAGIDGQPGKNDGQLEAQEELFTSLPAEPWFYASLWRYGQALRFFADGGALLFGVWCLFVFLDLGGAATTKAYTGLATAGLISSLFVVGLVWFILRLVSDAVLLLVDAARNIRNAWLATEDAHYH